jgi:hypothetical protein
MRLFGRSPLALLSLVVAISSAPGKDNPRVPTIDDLLKIDSVSGVHIAPNGKPGECRSRRRMRVESAAAVMPVDSRLGQEDDSGTPHIWEARASKEISVIGNSLSGLIPGSDVPYFSCQAGKHRESAFLDVFRTAWAMIPDDAAGQILAYWGDATAPGFVLLMPCDLHKQTEPLTKSESLGTCIRIDRERLFSLPSPIWLPIVIIHELAHV